MDACGQRGSKEKPDFFVDVINGWPLTVVQCWPNGRSCSLEACILTFVDSVLPFNKQVLFFHFIHSFLFNAFLFNSAYDANLKNSYTQSFSSPWSFFYRPT